MISPENADDPASPAVGRWEYYEILGVSKNFSSDELKQKRKRLALRYHPDKNQGEPDTAQQKMQQVNRAYEVLSDPMKKKLYDRYGLEALNMYENNMITENMWKFIFIVVHNKFISFIGICCLVIFTLLIASPILIGYKLEGTINTSWLIVFIPIFILELLLLLVVAAKNVLMVTFGEGESDDSESQGNDSFLHEDKKKKMKKSEIFWMMVPICYLVSLIAFQVLLGLQLDGTVNLNWFIVFSPLFLAVGLFIFSEFPLLTYASYLEEQSTSTFHCHLRYVGYLMRNLYSDFLLLAFVVLFPVNLEFAPEPTEDEPGVAGYFSWWYVFIPVFVWAIIALTLSVIENCCYDKLNKKDAFQIEEEGGETENDEEKAHEAPPKLLLYLFLLCTCIFVSVVASFSALAAGWLQDESYTAMVALIPVITLFSLFACVCICCAFPLYACLTFSLGKGESGPPVVPFATQPEKSKE